MELYSATESMKYWLEGKIYDRKGLEQAIFQFRHEGSIEKANYARNELLEYHVMNVGQIREWISDCASNSSYYDYFTARLILDALDDILDVECYKQILKLIESSPNIKLSLKYRLYLDAAKTIGHDLEQGHFVFEKFLEFSSNIDHAAADIPDKVQIDKSYHLIEAELQSLPTAKAFNLLRKFKSNLSSVKSQAVYEEIKYLASPKEILDYFLSHRETCNGLIEMQYRLVLREDPSNVSLWLEYIEYWEETDKINATKRAHLSRRHNPFCLDLWKKFAFLEEQVEHPYTSMDNYICALVMLSKFPKLQAILVKDFMCMIQRVLPQQQHGGRDFIGAISSLDSFPDFVTNAALMEAGSLCFEGAMYEIGRNFIESVKNKDAYFYQVYAELESRLSFRKAQKLFAEGAALLSSSDAQYFEAFFSSWLKAERRQGTVGSYMEAQKCYRKKKAELEKYASFLKRSVIAEAQVTDRKNLSKKPKLEEPAPLQVDIAPEKEKTIFVNNIDFSVQDMQLKKFFEENVGLVKAIHMGRKANGEPRGFANVEFHDSKAVEDALALDRTRINGRPLFISRYQTVGGKDWKKVVDRPAGPDPSTLYVSNLDHSTTEEHIQELFGSYKGLKEVRLGLNKDGTCKGFAYVQFDNADCAKAALEENGRIFKGQAINVYISDPTLAPKVQHQKKAMVPLSLQRSKAKIVTEQASKQPVESAEKPTGENVKGNADFRKMFGL